ncbi:MAG: exodeoxyribonuclease VII large subunit, partial [Pseudomonadota bacterium]|nr:exodeoxyribonuclease VII large subunit [Pseudomonadota bacterium]
MEDLLSSLAAPAAAVQTQNEEKEYTVSEISAEIKRFVETKFNRVRIKGEIFGAKRADSGHYYLSLKDENAVIAAVCWRGVAAGLKIKPEDGLEVIATGKITTFAGKSSYQLVIEQMEVAGAGALLKLLEERKQQFAAEGLFDPAHKKKIPYLPQTIGVVTSASGAVIRDIIHRVRDRFPSHIVLWPTPVQGEGAAEKIAAAVKGFNCLPANGQIPRPDVIIVARGGGSLEDLWPFNEEIVIRAVFASEIPVISAVGHETDTMLIDYVSDIRAPTPTGAAEFAVPVKAELESRLSIIQGRLINAAHRYLSSYQTKLEGLSRGIPNLEQILLENQQKLDDRTERLKLSFTNFLNNKYSQIEKNNLRPYYILNIFEKKQENLKNLSLRLDSVSVEAVLRRGFAWVRNNKGKTIYSVTDALHTP